MNEVDVSIEAKPPAAEGEDERDPLALEEEEREEDPLAVSAVVKMEPGVEHLEEQHKVEDLRNKDEEIVKSNETREPKEKQDNSIERPTAFTDPTEKTATENRPLSRKPSKEEAKSKSSEEVADMNVDPPSTKEANIETNGTTDKNTNDSNVNGSEKHESYEQLNGEAKKEPTRKRSSETTPESPTKKLCVEVQKTFPHHDNMINDYIQTTTRNNVDEIQRHTEQLLSEIQTLRELAQKKEHEWNSILHLKKVKEEILLRLLRRKQVLSFEKSPEVNGNDNSEAIDLVTQPKSFTIDKSDEISGVAIKQPGSTMNNISGPSSNLVAPGISHYNPLTAPPPYDKGVNSLPKAMYPHPIVMPGPRMPGFDLNGQLMAGYNMQMGRQGPVKDVKSIIADYRQRHPETVPRRGRRMKSMLNPQMGGSLRAIAPKMDSLNNLGMLLNNMDMNQKSMLERLSQVQAGALPNGVSFKDILIQFANMQQQQQSAAGLLATRPQLDNLLAAQRQAETKHGQDAVTVTKTDKETSRAQTESRTSDLHKTNERQNLPPPYPEISLHPVVSSSNSGEQPSQNSSLLHGILTKSCGEITITPVQPKNKDPPAPSANTTSNSNTSNTTVAEPTPEEVVQLEDEESAASEASGGEAEGSSGEGGSRLVIDEAGSSDVPMCQGCRRRDAQFVCAGCANQWYCSRECQVAAWDEHSEMCSG